MSNTPKVEFEFSINSDSFNRNLKNMNDSLKIARNDIENASNSIKQFGKNSETLAKQYDAINKALGQSKEKVNAYQKEIDKTTDTLNKNKTKLSEIGTEKDKLNKKYQEAVKVYGKESEEAKKLKSELDNLNVKYKEQENKVTSNENAIQRYTVGMSNAQREVSRLETQLAQCSQAIETNANKFLQAQQKLENASKTFLAVGDGIDNVSNKILAVSTPIAGAGIAIGKLAMDFEDGIANINTLLDDTSHLDSYRDKIMEVSNLTGMDLDIVTQGMYQLISSIGDGGEVTQEMFDLMSMSAKAGGASMADTIALLTSGMKGYNVVNEVGAEKISDLAFMTQKLGVTTFPELAKSMGALFPLGASLGISLEDLFSVMATGTGVTGNTSEVATQFKAVMSNLIKPTDTMTKLMAKYGYTNAQAMIETEGLTGFLQILQKETGGEADKMGELFSSTEALTLITALCGNNFEDFITKNEKMNNSLGTTSEAYEKVSNTIGEKFKRALNELKNSFVELGGALAPTMEKIAEGILKVTEFIGEMDEETVANIFNLSLWGVGLGTAGKAIGGMSKGIGGALGGLSKFAGFLATTTSATAGFGTVAGTTATATASLGTVTATAGLSIGALAVPLGVVAGAIGILATGFYAVKEGSDVLNSSIAKSTDEMSLMEKGMAKLMGIQTYSKDELVSMGLAYKDFNENISEDFRKAVEDMTLDIHDFGMSLDEINVDGVLSEEEVNNLSTRVDNAMQSCLSTIEGKGAEIQQGLNEAFSADGLIDETEQQLLDYWSSRGNTEKEEAQKLQTEINEILNNAKGRELTPEEEQSIKERYARIKQIELECQASNSYEIEYATQEFQNRISTLDAEGATELLQNRYKQYEEQQIATKTNYDTLIAQAKIGYDNLSAEERKYVDDTVKRLEDARDKELTTNKQYYDSDVAYAKEHCNNLGLIFNKYTGEMVARQDEANYKMYEGAREHYDGIEKISKSGMTKLYNTETKTWDDLYVKVDDVTGELIGCYNYNSKECGAMTSKNASAIRAEADQFKINNNNIKNSILDSTASFVNAKGQVVSASGAIIGSLQDIKTNADGTRTGVINLNGTPIQVKVNKDGTIANLNEVKNKINEVDGKQANINVTENGSSNRVQNRIDGIHGKTVTVTVQSIMRGNVSQLTGTGGRWTLATGTPYANQSGIANVNEKGWELFDAPPNETAFSLGKALQGDMAYIPEGTRVSTNLSSTQQMHQAVTNEVNRQLNRGLSEEINKMTKSLVKAIKDNNGADVDITNNNTFNVETTTDFEAERFETNVEKLLVKDIRRFGKIIN